LKRLTGAELAAAVLVSAPASTIVAAYLLDRFGLAFQPARLLAVAAAAAIGTGVWLWPRADRRPRELAVLGVILGAVFGWLMWLARPAFLPMGSGPDLTHHLLLIGFIEQHWTLVHDAAVEWSLGEMVHYTPGSQILAALAGRAIGSDGLHAVHPLLAALVALKAGVVFVIAERVLPPTNRRTPFAVLAVLLLFVPSNYFLGSFIHESFVAQVAGELFAVAMWWMLVIWDETAWIGALLLFGLYGTAAFLTWPVWIGAPMLALGILIAARERLSMRDRARHLVAGVALILLVASLYVIGRLGWARIVRTGGAILHPSIGEYGWIFLALSTAGIVLAARERRGRPLAALVAAIGVQMLGLYLTSQADQTPYMALKMFYLLIYPQAVAAALAVGFAAENILSRAGTAAKPAAAWAAVGVFAILIARPLTTSREATGAVSQPLAMAGQWARQHVDPSCVEYLVGDPATAYWLHLAVLGNPRMSARTGEDTTYDRTAAIVRWLTPNGYPYAIADLDALSADVRSDLDIVADFGSAAVAKRRGPSECPASR
jgi:hypothetical protein